MEIKIFGKVLKFMEKPPVKQEQILKSEAFGSVEGLQEIIHENKIEEHKPVIQSIYNKNEKSLIVIFDGDVYTGHIEDESVIDRVKNAKSGSEVAQLLAPKEAIKEETAVELPIEDEEKEIVSDYLDIFHNSPDFEVENNSVFFKGIKSVEIPSIIVANFIEILEQTNYFENLKTDEFTEGFSMEDQDKLDSLKEEYEALKMFTLKLLCNSLPESREQLLTFVRNNDVKITSTGNLVLYRRANKATDENTEFVEFISSQYLKVKSHKKSPKNYYVTAKFNVDAHSANESNFLGYTLQNTDFISDMQILKGNLYELYVNLPTLKENLYQAAHKGAMKFKIGDIYKIEEKEVDLNADVCHSGGLHCCNYSYNYSGYGSVPLVVLVNPAKTITVPTYDFAKMRVSEMFIVGIHENPGQHVSEEVVHNFDETYHNYSIQELEEALRNKSVAPVSIAESVSDLSLKEVVNITEKLRGRVVVI